LSVGLLVWLWGRPEAAPTDVAPPRLPAAAPEASVGSAGDAEPLPPGPGIESVNAHPSGQAGPGPEAPNPGDLVDPGAAVGIRSPPGLYGGAKVEPLYDLRSDEVQGVRVSRIREGSFWELLGIRERDVLLEVNGQLVDTPSASVTLMNSLSREPVLILRLRGEDGRERFLEYRSPWEP